MRIPGDPRTIAEALILRCVANDEYIVCDKRMCAKIIVSGKLGGRPAKTCFKPLLVVPVDQGDDRYRSPQRPGCEPSQAAQHGLQWCVGRFDAVPCRAASFVAGNWRRHRTIPSGMASCKGIPPQRHLR